MSFLDIMVGIFQGFGVTATVTLLGLIYAIPFALSVLGRLRSAEAPLRQAISKFMPGSLASCL